LRLRELKREFNSKLDPIIPIYRKPKIEDLGSTIMVQPIKSGHVNTKIHAPVTYSKKKNFHAKNYSCKSIILGLTKNWNLY
jgi:hypothetical protein